MSATVQQAFEEYAKTLGTKLDLTTNAPSHPDIYVNGETALAYADFCAGWQASRRAALEEAAKTVGALHEKISAQEIIGFDAWSAGHLALDNAACHILALANGEAHE